MCNDYAAKAAEAEQLLASYRRIIDNLTALLREARPLCAGHGPTCCGSFIVSGPNCDEDCCGHKVDLADRIGFALTMLEPHDIGSTEVSQG